MNVFRLLGWRTKQLRLAMKLTQEELAFRVGAVDQAYISELEHGKGNPTLQTIHDLAKALNTTIPELFSSEGAPPQILKIVPRNRTIK
jgi:transcriptional regulator with XRE-family HTH domain